MSQQPPYGEPPHNPQHNPQQYPQQYPQQQPGYTPYGQGGYPPNPYGAQPQGKSHTTRNILIVVTVLVVLFCGGITTAVVLLIRGAEDAFDSNFNEDYVGSEDDPLVLEEGEAFSIRGFDYDEGWSVNLVPDGEGTIENLTTTNNRDDEESETIFLVVTFLKDNQGVGEMRCSSPTSVRFERSATMDCSGYDIPADYDTIEIYDDALYE